MFETVQVKITMSFEPVCDLSMIKAEYLRPASNDQSPFYGYRVAVTLNGEINAQFDVRQDEADKFANELVSLAALIRAHTRHRGPR